MFAYAFVSRLNMFFCHFSLVCWYFGPRKAHRKRQGPDDLCLVFKLVNSRRLISQKYSSDAFLIFVYISSAVTCN